MKKNIQMLLATMTILCFSSARAQTGIEGTWKDNKNGGTILIYEENGLYFGQLIASDKPEENQKIQAREDKIVLLRDFRKKNDNKFCCGTIYQPREKRSLSGTLTLEDDNTLKVTGKYGIIKGSQLWKRL